MGSDLHPTAEAAREALEAFDGGHWGKKYPSIARQGWRRNWEQVIPFFAFPIAVRRIIYTTNAIESLNAKLRRAVRTRGHFPTDDTAMKLLYLVLRQVAGESKMAPREWCRRKIHSPSCSPIASSRRDGNPTPRIRFLTVPSRFFRSRPT